MSSALHLRASSNRLQNSLLFWGAAVEVASSDLSPVVNDVWVRRKSVRKKMNRSIKYTCGNAQVWNTTTGGIDYCLITLLIGGFMLVR